MRTLTLIVAVSCTAMAQSKVEIEKKLLAEFTVTQPTADLTDIVTAGSILVLKKGNIVMDAASAQNYFQNIYKDGKISQNTLGKLNSGIGRLRQMRGAAPVGPATRTFVPGEKFWVTKIECKDDGVVFQLFTDAFDNVRYKAELKFAFEKAGAMPKADDMDKLVAEVLKIQPPDTTTGAAAPAAGPDVNRATVP